MLNHREAMLVKSCPLSFRNITRVSRFHHSIHRLAKRGILLSKKGHFARQKGAFCFPLTRVVVTSESSGGAKSLADWRLTSPAIVVGKLGTGEAMFFVAFAVYGFIFYLVDSFCSYLASSRYKRMEEAEENAEEDAESDSTDVQGMTSDLTDESDRTEGTPTADTTLLSDEAKRTIAAHPDWGNNAIAQHCGFTDRTVLQRTFKEIEGITPKKYQENLSKGE